MRLGASVDAVDLFCGFGGSSQGIHKAGAAVRLAANHDQHAVDVHAANFPDTDHVVADLSDDDQPSYVDPASLPAARFLWASPSCRFHSPANAKKLYQRGPSLFADDDFDHDLYANSERSRVTMLCPLRYAAKHHPEAVVVENVAEAAKWGPNRDGSTFTWWLSEWAKLGYQYRVLFLNSMFFPPCPQSRDRMYIVLWRSGNLAPDLEHQPSAWCLECDALVESRQVWKARTETWPLPQWGKWGRQYDYRCPAGHTVTPLAYPAATAIDWSNLGSKIGDRPRPLAPRTISRIRRGLSKFADFPVVIRDGSIIAGAVDFDGGDTRYRRSRHPSEPFPTAVTTTRPSIAASIVVAHGHTSERPGQLRARHVAEEMWVQTTSGTVGLAWMPGVVTLRGSADRQVETSGAHVFDPLGTISAGGGHHGLIIGGWVKQNAGADGTAWHPFSDPFGSMTARDTTGVAFIDQYRSEPTHPLEPVAAALTHLRHALAAAVPGDPEKVAVDDIRFRMLEPDPEIRRVMAFPDDFMLFGTKTRITAGLGNAVTPPVADWITGRVLSTLDERSAA